MNGNNEKAQISRLKNNTVSESGILEILGMRWKRKGESYPGRCVEEVHTAEKKTRKENRLEERRMSMKSSQTSVPL